MYNEALDVILDLMGLFDGFMLVGQVRGGVRAYL
jgi:hypothetical protein